MIYFRTPGPLAREAFTTFGLTSKEENQIGRFGTGLKYATAIIVRLGGTIEVRTPQASLRTGVEPGLFRNKPVGFVTLNDERLPFTTELGRDWKPWMAFREFYANTLDEGGSFGRGACEPTPGETVIQIDCAELEAVMDNFEEHFIDPLETPLYETDSIRIFPGRSKQIFYRGFAIAEIEEPAQFRYDLKGHVSLTEDRTASSMWNIFGRLESAIANCTDEAILRATLRADAPFESCLSFVGDTPSAAFCGITEQLGDEAGAQAILALSRARYANDKANASLLEETSKSSVNLMNAIAHLKLINAPIAGLKFALLPIPDGAPFEVDTYRSTIIINEDAREDADACIERIFKAYCQMRSGFAVPRLIQLAKQIGQSAK